MNKYIVFLCAMWLLVACGGETQTAEKATTSSHSEDVYKLYPTSNMWTFIKLNTADGRMWQVQYDIKGDNRKVSNLNIIKLAKGEDMINGRFELYETQNMYNFILLDKIDGRQWQVQWSHDVLDRIVLPIE